MNLEKIIKSDLQLVFKSLYQIETDDDLFALQYTRKEFEGDRTLVVFPFLKITGKSPEETGNQIGNALLKQSEIVSDFNVVKGFLNIGIKTSFWLKWIQNPTPEKGEADDGIYMVEYSSPNTNKPLHLGHIRNNLLGYSVSQLLGAANKNVCKVQVINDRGIHICKSMLAWERYGEGKTPENTGIKGDHLVGDYYVKFDQVYKKEVSALVDGGMDVKTAEKSASILSDAQDLLRKWEDGDQAVVSLWKMMNDWVYAGFTETYRNLGVDFDKLYYESDTYLVGKQEVLKGVESGIFYREKDGSVWVDLTDEGLDKKVLIRADGTSVYMTQDIGTAILRFRDFPALKQLIYTVGNEQNYHFKVLFIILRKLGYAWAEECKHLSYGMVELPTGKMKSREGRVVDADDLIEEMRDTARSKAEELGKLDDFSEEEKEELYSVIGLGALKYYILKVDPKKQITFNPEESIDFAGNTGPFIQYTHARIKTLLSKADNVSNEIDLNIDISETEKNIVHDLYRYGEVLETAVKELNPAHLANYCYELVKGYNFMYQTIPILKEEDGEKRKFRLYLSECVARQIKDAMQLLGITVPDRM